MQSQIIIKNLLISYLESGKKDSGTTILFLHGWRSQKEIWTEALQKLGNWEIGKFSSFALDLPGFGGSQTPPAPMTVGDYAEIVAEFIKKLDLKKVTIIGHSFGGRVGIKLAANYPEIVSKLVLVASAGFPMDSNKKNALGAAAKIAKPFFKPQFMHGLRKKIYNQIGAEDYLATPQLQKTFVNTVSEDLSEDMKKIRCSTLIITGKNDADTPVSFGDRMQNLIPNSKFVILPNAGHFSFLDQPEEFVKELHNFI